MYLAHKIELKPNKKQVEFFTKSCGVARFVYNWSLAKWKELYEAGEKIISNEIINRINKEFTKIKKTEFPWVMEVSKNVPEGSFKNLREAYIAFFKGKANHPKFKKKNRSKDAFYVDNHKFKITDTHVFIPRLGMVRLKESLRLNGKIMRSIVSRTADKWFISIVVEIPDTIPVVCENQAAIGVDVGVSALATLSNGEKFYAPRPLERGLKRLARRNRALERSEVGSKNWEKKRKKLARLHYEIACIRKDSIHKLTSFLVEKYNTIAVEDLDVLGLIKNRKINRSIHDTGFAAIKPQLEYKMKLNGKDLTVVDRYYPSSKTCSCCGNVKKSLFVWERVFKCNSCGAVMDRDVNAAINLVTVGCTGNKACGDRASLKQEATSGRTTESIFYAQIKEPDLGLHNS